MDEKKKDTEELEELLKKQKADRNYYFFKPVGQFIEHVDTVNFSMDKDGNFHFENVGQVNKQNAAGENKPKERKATKEMMSRAAKTTQEAGYWKSQRSWSVVYVVYGIWGYQGSVSDFLDEVPVWPDGVDKSVICNRDAVEKLKNKYNFTKHIEEWRDNGVPEQYCILGEQLESELVKLLAEQEDTLHNRFDSCV